MKIEYFRHYLNYISRGAFKTIFTLFKIIPAAEYTQLVLFLTKEIETQTYIFFTSSCPFSKPNKSNRGRFKRLLLSPLIHMLQ